ncbi:MAG: hypothetical protein IJW43_02405 [Clostridia bacterium]|nr:hypothetical protein [Clostridia bacterium]
MKSKILALSAISAGLVALVLTIGTYFNVADIFCLALASCFVTLPLSYKSYLGSILSYLVGGVLAFLFTGFNIFIATVPAYFVFFGIYPIIKQLLRQKQVNKIISYIIGLIWGIACAYGMYFYYVNFMGITFSDLPLFVHENILYLVGAIGGLFFVVYERFITVSKRFIDITVAKIIK